MVEAASASRRLWTGAGVVLLLGGSAFTLMLARPGLAAEAGAAGETNSMPQLPLVARPAAQQPVIGLPSDHHLDKTPPRATRGLDLVKSGWTYNCMECH